MSACYYLVFCVLGGGSSPGAAACCQSRSGTAPSLFAAFLTAPSPEVTALDSCRPPDRPRLLLRPPFYLCLTCKTTVPVCTCVREGGSWSCDGSRDQERGGSVMEKHYCSDPPLPHHDSVMSSPVICPPPLMLVEVGPEGNKDSLPG